MKNWGGKLGMIKRSTIKSKYFNSRNVFGVSILVLAAIASGCGQSGQITSVSANEQKAAGNTGSGANSGQSTDSNTGSSSGNSGSSNQNGGSNSNTNPASDPGVIVKDPSSNPAPNPTPAPAPTYSTNQKSVTVNAISKVDILVIIDNSGSMKYEQQNMAQRFGTFIDELKGLDWQVGIITTDCDGDSDKKDGRLLSFSGMNNVQVLDSNMNIDVVKQAFAKTIQRPASEGSGYEQGIKATYRALERALSQDSVNAGNRKLIRPDAALSVLVVSDADETPIQKADIKNSPGSLLEFVKFKFGSSKMFVFNSIVVQDGDKACLAKDGNEAYGLSYISLSQKTNGIIGNVCAADYSSQLKFIGQKTQDSVKTIRLDCTPADADQDGKLDIVISNSAGDSIPSYIVNQNDLVFDSVLPVGVNTVKYSCKNP